MRRVSREVVLISLVILFVLSSLPANALDVGLRGINPANPTASTGPGASWFLYTLNPGETKVDAVRITNQTDHPITFEVYPVDAETTEDGAYAPLAKDYQHKDVGSWVKMERGVVEVPSKTDVEVPFTVMVPKEDVDVGEHYGAIIIEELDERKPLERGSGLQIITRVGVRMYITIPGDIRKELVFKDPTVKLFSRLVFQKEIAWLDRCLSFLGLMPAARFTLTFQNTGNVRIEPFGQIRIKNIFGRTIHTTEDKYFGMVMPGRTNEVPIDWPNPPFIGKFTASAEIRYEGGQNLTRTVSFWIIPYPLLILLATAIFLIIISRLLFQLIVAKEKSKMKIHVVAEGETVEKIAEQYRMSWKLLVRVNKLKPPYQLTAGQELLIPIEGVWRSFIKSFFRSKKNIIILVVVIAVIAGAIGYWRWYSRQQIIRNIQKAAEEDKEHQEELKVVLGERTEADKARKADLKTAQEALERYYQKDGHYPISVERSKTTEEGNIFKVELAAKGHLLQVPLDPKHPNYYYGYKSDAEGKSYELTCVLENRSDQEGIIINDAFFYRLKSPSDAIEITDSKAEEKSE